MPYFKFLRTHHSITALDGLRALAIILVLGRHALWPLYKETGQLFPIGQWDAAIPFINGWIGVDLFFVLSGFLISRLLLRRNIGGQGFSYGRYLGARALRIVPAYFAVIALVLCELVPYYDVSTKDIGYSLRYHLLFLQDYFPSNIVVAFWSLGVEEKFYLIAPLIVLVAVNRNRWFAWSGLVLLLILPTIFRASLAASRPDITDYDWFFPVFRSPFHVSFDGLVVGVMCALLCNHREFREAMNKHAALGRGVFWAGALGIGVLMFTDNLLGDIGLYEKVFQPLVVALLFGAVVLGAVFGGGPKTFLGSKAMLIIARISYPLYLIHVPMVSFALAVSGYGVAMDVHLLPLYLACYVAASTSAALALHFAVEKPFLVLKDHFFARQVAVDGGLPRAA